MIKIAKKFFTSPEQIEDSKVEFVVEIPEKTKTELFDEAVKKVIREKLRETLKDELREMCYEEEQIRQTKLALEENGGYVNVSESNVAALLEKFPKTQISISSRGPARIELEFNLNNFVDKLLDSVL